MPSPRTAAATVMVMLALGVLLGSVTGRVAQSAGLSSILVEVPAPERSPLPPEEEFEPAPAPAGSSTVAAPVAEVPETAPTPKAAPEEAPAEPPVEEFDPEEGGGLPDVEHVFLIVLGENSFEEAFGPAAPSPYLAKTLPEQGELLSNYYAVAKGDLANQIALLSGQGPTPETSLDCPNYVDVAPGTVTPEGQVQGNGCVYPAGTPTLVGQLAAAGMEWKAYVEDIGNSPAEPTTCRHPPLGAPDPRQAPLPGDAYVTWRNPFVYFHSIVDSPECAERDVGLDRLEADLKSAKTTPTLSYIVPNACHDGGLAPCAPGAVTGPLETEAFLTAVVPQILASPAYAEGGLVVIASTQAQQGGEHPDAGACCAYPAYPNVPPPPEEPPNGPTRAAGGGGRVGLLLLSPFVEPGSTSEGFANHFTLLLTLEELLGLEKLGYANEPSLAPLESTVFNAGAVRPGPAPAPRTR